MSASASDVPSQFGAAELHPELHPEFGYFAPTMRFRRKVALTLKGAALGLLVGAVTVFFMTIEREEQALTMLATPVLLAPAPPKPAQVAMPTRMAAVDTFAPVLFVPGSIALPAVAPTRPPVRSNASTAVNVAPVRFVPESIALPVAVPTSPPLRGTISTVVAAAASAPAPLAPPAVAPSPAAPVVATAPAPEPAPAAKAAAKPKKKIVREPQPERTARPVPPEPEPRSAFASPFRRFGLPIFGFGQ
jgi:hypothetical protein